jgi:hypothetical protein
LPAGTYEDLTIDADLHEELGILTAEIRARKAAENVAKPIRPDELADALRRARPLAERSTQVRTTPASG